MNLLGKFFLAAAFCILLGVLKLHSTTTYTHYPSSYSSKSPSWLVATPEITSSNGFSTIRYKISPPKGYNSLAITLIYDDNTRLKHFIRVIWDGHAGPVLISNNICEGTSFYNSRMLVLNSKYLSGPGDLVIQSSSSQLGIISVNFEWLNETIILKSCDFTSDSAILTNTGRFISGASPNKNLDVEETYVIDRLDGKFTMTSLVDLPLVINAVPRNYFEIELNSNLPALTRLSLDVLGVSSSTKIEVYLNNKNLGELSLEAPDLRENEYLWTLKNTSSPYAHLMFHGWRKASFLIPESIFESGSNYLYFRAVDKNNTSEEKRFAVKNFDIQFRFRPTLEKKDFDPEKQPDLKKSDKSSNKINYNINDINVTNDSQEFLSPLPRGGLRPEVIKSITPNPIYPKKFLDSLPDNKNYHYLNTG